MSWATIVQLLLKLVRSPTFWAYLALSSVVGYGAVEWYKVNSRLNRAESKLEVSESKLGVAQGRIASLESDSIAIKARLAETEVIRESVYQFMELQISQLEAIRSNFTKGLVEARSKGKENEFINTQFHRRLDCIELVTKAKTQEDLNKVVETCQ